MADAAEWGADLGRDDQEGSWNGADRADEARPGGMPGFGSDRLPEHVPQLHRAMSEAAEGLDAVEDRLSTLFERTEAPWPGSATRPASTQLSTVHPEFAAAAGMTSGGAADDDDDDVFDLFEDEVGEEADEDFVIVSAEPAVADRMAIIGEYEDDIGGAFAELDAELAAEEPDEPAGKGKRRKFGRRSKKTAASRR